MKYLPAICVIAGALFAFSLLQRFSCPTCSETQLFIIGICAYTLGVILIFVLIFLERRGE